MKGRFEVRFMEEALDFLAKLSDQAREKIIYNINKAERVQDKELFKKLTGTIWEFRTLHNKTYYRMLAFWDKTGKMESLVIATHGLVKKTKKLPTSEIAKADRLMQAYFAQKGKVHEQ